ncbi:MAG: hypothetical protein ACO3CR_02075 [Solirubrobacterales bacterium]
MTSITQCQILPDGVGHSGWTGSCDGALGAARKGGRSSLEDMGEAGFEPA